LTVGLIWSSYAAAAKLDKFLTSEDLAGRMLLDQNGQQLLLPSGDDRHVAVPKGSTPTYLAIPLDGGEHLPGSIPTIMTGSQQSQTTVGPLNFNAQVKTALNTALDTTKLVVVETLDRNYLVEFLPGRDHSRSTPGTDAANELAHLLSMGTTQFTKLTQSGMNELDKLLNLSGSKTSTPKAPLNLEAQVLGSALPPPIPEPSTWLVFIGLLLGAARLRRLLPRRVGTSD